jgi:hypothetical protein
VSILASAIPAFTAKNNFCRSGDVSAEGFLYFLLFLKKNLLKITIHVKISSVFSGK